MIRSDGVFGTYMVQHRQDDGKWVASNFDFFGSPPGFTASCDCWQVTGIRGTYYKVVARKGLDWIRRKHPGRKFRLVYVVVSRLTTVIGDLS
jgi:hypothetical protein